MNETSKEIRQHIELTIHSKFWKIAKDTGLVFWLMKPNKHSLPTNYGLEEELERYGYEVLVLWNRSVVEIYVRDEIVEKIFLELLGEPSEEGGDCYLYE